MKARWSKRTMGSARWMLTRKMTITIKNEEADEVGRGYQLNGASTIPTSGLVEWSGEGRG